jgi:hypothetical protein
VVGCFAQLSQQRQQPALVKSDLLSGQIPVGFVVMSVHMWRFIGLGLVVPSDELLLLGQQGPFRRLTGTWGGYVVGLDTRIGGG